METSVNMHCNKRKEKGKRKYDDMDKGNKSKRHCSTAIIPQHVADATMLNRKDIPLFQDTDWTLPSQEELEDVYALPWFVGMEMWDVKMRKFVRVGDCFRYCYQNVPYCRFNGSFYHTYMGKTGLRTFAFISSELLVNHTPGVFTIKSKDTVMLDGLATYLIAYRLA